MSICSQYGAECFAETFAKTFAKDPPRIGAPLPRGLRAPHASRDRNMMPNTNICCPHTLALGAVSKYGKHKTCTKINIGICMYIYIYMYLDIQTFNHIFSYPINNMYLSPSLSLSPYKYIYIYMHIYTNKILYIYIYIYIYMSICSQYGAE